MITESAVRSIRDFDSFLDFLRCELLWPIPEGPLDVEDITYDFSPDELNLDEAARRRLRDDCIRQLMPFTPGQPWGIFLVELHEPKVYTTFLRRLLRRLVLNSRTASHLRGWDAENLLFICTPDYRSFTFATSPAISLTPPNLQRSVGRPMSPSARSVSLTCPRSV